MFTIAMGNQFKITGAAILNLGFNQNFCTKSGTVMDDEQHTSHKPNFRKSNIADGRHLQSH